MPLGRICSETGAICFVERCLSKRRCLHPRRLARAWAKRKRNPQRKVWDSRRWRRVREQVRARDGGCVDCGSDERMSTFLPSGSGRGGAPAAAVSNHSAATVSGGTKAEHALMQQIVDGMGPTGLTRIRIGPVVKPFRSHQPKNAVMLNIGTNHWSLRREWQATLVTSVFRNRSRALGLPSVAAFTFPKAGEGYPPNSATAHSSPLKASPEATAALRARVLSAAARAGANISQLRMIAPYGVGIEVVLRANRPAAFLEHRLGPFLKVFDKAAQAREGDFITVVNSAGRTVWASGGLTRQSEGMNWVLPRLGGCNPVIQIGRLGYNPPPCPARES